MKTIAIDLGSNTLQVLKYDCIVKEKLAHYQKNVRTAERLIQSGVISNEATKRILEALKEAKSKIDFSDSKVVAVSTEALRVAKNQKEVAEVLYRESGVKFKVITPELEAKLTLLAVKNRLNLLGYIGNFVVVDIGGGSTEIAYYIDGKIYSKSFKLGIVTTANSCSSLDEIKKFVKERIEEIKEFTDNSKGRDFIFSATAGTPTTLAAMKHNLTYQTYNADTVTGTKLRIDELDIYLNRLLEMDKREREITVGVGRDDLILAGIIIFKEIYKILEKEEAIVVDDGLSMGVAIASCKGEI